MDIVRYVLFTQHPYMLLAIGALLAVSFAGLVVLAIRIYQYLTWRADQPHRELLVIASGLSSIGRQGRLPLPSPTVGSRLAGSTPRVDSPPPPQGDPRPASPPYSPYEAYRDADGYLDIDSMPPCDQASFYDHDNEPLQDNLSRSGW